MPRIAKRSAPKSFQNGAARKRPVVILAEVVVPHANVDKIQVFIRDIDTPNIKRLILNSSTQGNHQLLAILIFFSH